MLLNNVSSQPVVVCFQRFRRTLRLEGKEGADKTPWKSLVVGLDWNSFMLRE
jgi:hypothetical protein